MSRRWRIETALQSLMRERSLPTLDHLTAALAGGREPALAEAVVEALLNNETYFFRDRQIFDHFANGVLPALAARRAAGRKLSIWCVGCSTGQETLSVAMTFLEQQSRWDGWTIEIVGTDVSASAVDFARNATYSNFQIQRGLGVGQMLGYFTETPQGWRARDNLRQMVRYEVHNLLHPAPYPGQFDLILCRNVLIYFDGPVRARAFSRLAEALAADGRLLVGGGETVLEKGAELRPSEERFALYEPLAAADRPPRAQAA
jgi:chemotaxis protein methyltransferase CheR